MSIRDDCNAETVALGIADSQAHTVDSHRPFLYGHITFPGHCRVDCIFEGIIPTAVSFLHTETFGCRVDVSLHDMSVQASVDFHASLHVDEVTHFQTAEVAAFEGLLYGGDGVSAISGEGDNREAHSVMGYALVNAKFVGKWAAEGYMEVSLLVTQTGNLDCVFYYS